MTATTVVLPEAIDKLSALFSFREPEEVVRFLRTYPFLIPLLEEAWTVIARCFGSETEVLLEVVYDHATGDEADTELIAMIQTELPAVEAMPILDRFTDEWWLPNLRRAQCRLAFSLW